jgi:hypothetical protein
VLIADLDARLDEFGRLLAGCRQTLIGIENDPTYLVVRAASPSGVTAEKAGALLEGLPETWTHLGSIDAVLAEAREAIGHRNPNHAHQLLAGPSVMWTMRDGVVRQFTVHESLTAISTQLGTARERLVAIETAWTSTLPHLERDRAELDKLDSLAAEIGSGHTNEIAALRGRVESAITTIRNDPLGAAHVDRIDGELDRLRRMLEALRENRDGLPSRLSTANDTLAVIAATVARGHAAHERATQGIVDPVGLLPAIPLAAIDGDRGLRAQLDALATAPARSWRRQSGDLDTWSQAATELLARARRVEAANNEPLARRDELRGRLLAYHAKALATGHNEDARFVELYDTACRHLFATPTDLRLSARAVLAYADAVNGAAS